MNRITESLIARNQNLMSAHFERTKYGKKISELKGIHSNERCVIVGNGPSLRAEDLQKLHDAGVVCFGTNRIFYIYDNTDWRPTYYMSEDEDVLRSIQAEVSRLSAERKFIPINLRWYKDIHIDNADWFYLDYKGEYKESFGISVNPAHAIRCRGTVTTSCIQMAIYMGFSEIYLIGIDHNFAKMVDKNGNITEDNSVKNHFSEKYEVNMPTCYTKIDDTTEGYLSIEKLSRKTNAFRVYNATRGGKLEVFERVNFDDIFSDNTEKKI